MVVGHSRESPVPLFLSAPDATDGFGRGINSSSLSSAEELEGLRLQNHTFSEQTKTEEGSLPT